MCVIHIVFNVFFSRNTYVCAHFKGWLCSLYGIHLHVYMYIIQHMAFVYVQYVMNFVCVALYCTYM